MATFQEARLRPRLAPLLFLLAALPIHAADAPVTIKVMTRNMDAGTDLNLIVSAGDPAAFARGVAATLAEVKASNIPVRAARLADEIAAEMPDVIGLQEVTLWRTGPLSNEPAGASTVLYDQLDLLLTELGKRRLHYVPAVVNRLSDVEAPAPTENLNLRITDRDVILARSDVNQSVLDVFNVEARRYQIALPLGLVSPQLMGSMVYQGYSSADVTVRGKTIRFVNTHLLGLIPGVSLLTLGQLSEAAELLRSDVLTPRSMPVIMLGDFNSNAEPGPEHSGVVELVLAAGFTDVWRAVNPSDLGMTWPLFGEDLNAGKTVQTNERIDLIFERGLKPLSAKRLGAGGFNGPFASDHAGVVATIQIN